METTPNPVPKHSGSEPLPQTLAAAGDAAPAVAPPGLFRDDATSLTRRFMAWEPPIKEDESSWDSI